MQLHSPESPHVCVKNDSYELPCKCDVVLRQIMHARDASSFFPCCVAFFLATYHLDGRMDLSVETVWIPIGDTFQKAYLEEWQLVDDG